MKPRNLIALLLFLAALVGIFYIQPHSQLRLQGQYLSLVAPLMKNGSQVEQNLKSSLQEVESQLELLEENERLRAELQRLPLVEEERDALVLENESLRQSLGFVRQERLDLIPARVLKRETSTWWHVVLIDKGAEQGVRMDAPVRTAVGVVGKVIRVGDATSTVLLLTDEMCRVPVMVLDAGGEGLREYGIVHGGRGGVQVGAELQLTQLPRVSRAQPGSAVVTSGEGGLYPAGIPVGRVVSVQEGDLVGSGVLTPEVNFMDLRYLFVIDSQVVNTEQGS